MRTAIAVTLTAASLAHASTKFENVFPMPKPVIAVINLPYLPGQKGFVSMDHALKHAMDQLKVLEEEGVEAVLFENVDGDFGATPEMIAAMTRIVSEAVKQTSKVIVGVEVLWHDPKASLAIAKASGAQFIRTDFFADKMMAGKRLVDVNTKELIEYQKSIGAEDVLLLTDIQVKYAKMIDKKKTIRQSALDAKSKGSIGAIVSGAKSGVPPSVEKVKEAKSADLSFPVILGSGTNPENVKELLAVADAAIVGTAVSTKTGGVIIREKLQNYMKSVRELRAGLNQSPTVH